MPTTFDSQQSECQNPNCEEDGTKVYHDNCGNSIKVCPRHHYELVTGNRTITYTARNSADRGKYSVLDHLREVGGR